MSHQNIVELDTDGHRGAIFVARRGRPTCPRVPAGAFVTHAHSAFLYHRGAPARIEYAAPFDVRDGEVLLVPAGTPHRALTPPVSTVGVGFSPSCLDLGDPHLQSPFDRVRAGAAPVVSLPEARRELFETYLRELAEATRADAVSPLVTRSLLALLLNEIRSAASPLPPLSHAGDTLVADALRYIEGHCLGPLSLTQVAEHVRRTPAHVTTTLKRATGRSANQWIVAHRMAEARRRLRHSDEHVDVIAERVGYADATHFIRMFRRHHGATPAAWRRSLGPGAGSSEIGGRVEPAAASGA